MEMLATLGGSSHHVCTGVALIYGGAPGAEPRTVRFVETTRVEFGELSASVRLGL